VHEQSTECRAVLNPVGTQPRLTTVAAGAQADALFGAAADDRDVPLIVSGAAVDHGQVNLGQVETSLIAPTILRLLGSP
jgi:hypothetical protein